MAIIAAWHRFHSDKAAICVVDCGTATTIDGISESGQHLGGFIIPGYTMMQEILMNNTAKINIIKNSTPIIDFSNSTEQGVNNGCYLAMVASIDRIVAVMRKDYGERIRCIITGGNAKIILKQLATEFEHEPELVLHGLSLLSGQTK
jgi:type III pantothenate kinase